PYTPVPARPLLPGPAAVEPPVAGLFAAMTAVAEAAVARLPRAGILDDGQPGGAPLPCGCATLSCPASGFPAFGYRQALIPHHLGPPRAWGQAGHRPRPPRPRARPGPRPGRHFLPLALSPPAPRPGAGLPLAFT